MMRAANHDQSPGNTKVKQTAPELCLFALLRSIGTAAHAILAAANAARKALPPQSGPALLSVL